MRLIDTHCHLNVSEFNHDRMKVLSSAKKLGVEKIIVPAFCQNKWMSLLDICGQDKALYPALGLHPLFLGQQNASDLNKLENLLSRFSPVALGEIGLDYYLKDSDRHTQIKFFEAQLVIAVEADLPVILHCRKAYDELLLLVKKYPLKGGIAHAFNGSIQHAYQLIDLGFKLGFGGMLTYHRSTRLRKLAAMLPMSSIVLETDSPDMTVFQHLGERNSPEYLPYVLAALAQVRDETAQQLTDLIYQNTIEVFSI